MKACFLAVLSLLVASSSAAHLPYTETQAIAYVKSIDVKALDPSLHSQGLEDWLRSGPPHAEILRWELDGTCDLKPDDSDSDYPSCVRITFARGGHGGFFLVLIGTLKKGIVGPTRLYGGIDVWEEGFVGTGGTDRLSGLTDLLNQPLVSTPVTDLYEKVVARHPMGIPKGADKTAIWPFLSRRLIQQLETAQACQDDYFRQHPKGDTVPKPAWLNKGIFVGEGKHEAPLFINTGGKEPQKDGSFQVSMEAYERNNPGKHGYIVAGGIRARAFTPDQQWQIIATVVPEDNRFVVDDARIFDGGASDSPSHLLSDSFLGCDGPHWVGVGSTIR